MSTTTEQAKSQVASILEKGKEVLSDKKVLVPLLAAMAGGLTTGTLTSMEPPRQNESKLKRRLRILRNALIGAGAAGGAAALLPQGYKELTTMRPVEERDPVAEAIKSPLVMAGTGIGAFSLLNKNRSTEIGKAQEALTNVLSRNTTNPNSPLKILLDKLPKEMNSRDLHGHLLQIMENPKLRNEAMAALKQTGANEAALLNALREAKLPTTGLAGNSALSKGLHAAGDMLHGVIGGSTKPIIGSGTALLGSQRAKLLAALAAGLTLPLAASEVANRISEVEQ
jgi:hypothetical protein